MIYENAGRNLLQIIISLTNDLFQANNFILVPSFFLRIKNEIKILNIYYTVPKCKSYGAVYQLPGVSEIPICSIRVIVFYSIILVTRDASNAYALCISMHIQHPA